ncbi:hypothetical protein Tco_1260558 [Tanacetum coccineum]
MIDAAHRKRIKYEAKCANIGYGFLPFSFSSLGKLEKDAVNLLKRIRKFFVTQDVGARAVVHIFNRISFAIAKVVGAQLVYRLPTNYLFEYHHGPSGAKINRSRNLTGSSPLTQTGMADFVLGRAVIDVVQRKSGKYMAKCAAIGYDFLPFSFSSLGELEADAVTLLKRIRKFSMAQDIGARAAVHIFNRISFAIAKGVGAQIVSRLPSNLL